MTAPLVHLNANYLYQGAESFCGIRFPAHWTDDLQAVTCPKCIGRTELQPA